MTQNSSDWNRLFFMSNWLVSSRMDPSRSWRTRGKSGDVLWGGSGWSDPGMEYWRVDSHFEMLKESVSLGAWHTRGLTYKNNLIKLGKRDYAHCVCNYSRWSTLLSVHGDVILEPCEGVFSWDIEDDTRCVNPGRYRLHSSKFFRLVQRHPDPAQIPTAAADRIRWRWRPHLTRWMGRHSGIHSEESHSVVAELQPMSFEISTNCCLWRKICWPVSSCPG